MILKSWMFFIDGWRPIVELKVLHGCKKKKIISNENFLNFCTLKPGIGFGVSDPDLTH
jgi:hypothetical protein